MAEHLLAQKPDDPAYLNLLAACLGLWAKTRGSAKFMAVFRPTYPKQPRIWLNFGHALRTVGKSHEAVAAYRRCIALDPGLGDAYWSLANLKVADSQRRGEGGDAGPAGAPGFGVRKTGCTCIMRWARRWRTAATTPPRSNNIARARKLRRDGVTYDADETTALTRRSREIFHAGFLCRAPGRGRGLDRRRSSWSACPGPARP